jgi:transposase
MRKIRDALRLSFGESQSLRAVSSTLGVPVTTLADHLRRAKLAGLSWPLDDGLDDAALEALLFPPKPPSNVARPEPNFSEVALELRRKGVTLQLLWVEYREQHPDGYGYSQFANLYRAWRGRSDVVMRQSHRAGEKLFIDFSGAKFPIYGSNDTVTSEAELFIAVLGASSLLYAEAVASQQLSCWIGAHVNCFEFLGGVPEILVPDNLASGVTRANRYEPTLNPSYQDLARHYGVAIIPARPGKPRDKAKVEAGVLLAQRWIIARLRKAHFGSIAEANIEIAACVAEINDRAFKRIDGTRRSLFDELDRPAMRALPETRYEFATWKQARVNIDYHVEVEQHYYSVPYALVGEKVDVRMTAKMIEVFSSSKRVASHLRQTKRFCHSTEPSHMPESHRRHAEWTPSRILSWAMKTGPATAELVDKILEARPHPEQGFRSALGIIRLSSRYGQTRTEAACARALHLRSYSYRSVASILEHSLDSSPLPGTETQRSHPNHKNVRGAHYYQ